MISAGTCPRCGEAVVNGVHPWAECEATARRQKVNAICAIPQSQWTEEQASFVAEMQMARLTASAKSFDGAHDALLRLIAELLKKIQLEASAGESFVTPRMKDNAFARIEQIARLARFALLQELPE